MWECGIGIGDIMCDDLTYEDLHSTSMAGMDDITIWWSKSRCVRECGIRVDDKICDYITCEDLHLSSVARMDDITYIDLPYDDLNPDVWKNVVLGLMIYCVMI